MPTGQPCLNVFARCAEAIRKNKLISRESRQDKEFHFQNWSKARLEPILEVKLFVLAALTADQLVLANRFGAASENIKAWLASWHVVFISNPRLQVNKKGWQASNTERKQVHKAALGERLDCPAGLGAVQDVRCLVGQGEGELVAIGGSRGVVGLELGGFALEGGVEGRELRDGFLGQGEVLRVNLDADRLVTDSIGGGDG